MIPWPMTFLGLALMALSPGLRADDAEPEAPDSSISLTATLANDYVWRGASLSERKPSLQIDIDYQRPLGTLLGIGIDLEAGLWAYSTRYQERPELRLDTGAYAGLAGDLPHGWRWAAHMEHYRYPRAADWNYSGYALRLERAAGENPGSVGLALGHVRSQDVYGTGSLGRYLEADLSLRLPQGLLLTLHAGRSRYAREDLAYQNFSDRKIALSGHFGGNWHTLAWEAGWVSTSGDQFGRLGKGRALLSLSHSF